MAKYILRLDDACERRNLEKWTKTEALLDKYKIKPLVGVIPCCEDPQMQRYERDNNFWEVVQKWIDKEWTVAMHGYKHVYITENGGINPINRYSEFAGVAYEKQAIKIRRSWEIFKQHGYCPKVFFAPAHTFDQNTLRALELETEIRIISDTIAWAPYRKGAFTFYPQQSGKCRLLPFKMTTFCYHPNTMCEKEFTELESFIKKYQEKFIKFPLNESNRRYNIFDAVLNCIYMRMHCEKI